jgi:glyoxylate reductase
MTDRPRVVVVAALPEAGLDPLRQRFIVETAGLESRQSWLPNHADGADAIVTDPSIPVGAALLDSGGSSLKVVANFGVGYDNVDLDAARARKVRITNTPGVLTNATAELAVALMLACARRVAEADAMIRRNEWAQSEKELFGRELARATVGLVGFGRIGRQVMQLLRGFEVRLLVTSRSGGPLPTGVERRELQDLLTGSDFVSIHVPLNTDTRHLIDGRALAQMQQGAILVNTSRGAVVDTIALVEALQAGHLGAAGLDVYEHEPHVPAELLKLRNTVLLPHLGSATAATRDAMARLCAENVIAVIEGREPPTAVD